MSKLKHARKIAALIEQMANELPDNAEIDGDTIADYLAEHGCVVLDDSFDDVIRNVTGV